MKKLKFEPPWLNDFTGNIEETDVVKSIAEAQVDFFNWLYPNNLTSKRLPLTAPTSIFPLLMSEHWKSGPSWQTEVLLARVAEGNAGITATALYGTEVTADTDQQWVFKLVENVIVFTMQTCEPHRASFQINDECRAKNRFMTELFRFLRTLPRVVEATPTVSSQFTTQPILTALYAYHVSAYNI